MKEYKIFMKQYKFFWLEAYFMSKEDYKLCYNKFPIQIIDNDPIIIIIDDTLIYNENKVIGVIYEY